MSFFRRLFSRERSDNPKPTNDTPAAPTPTYEAVNRYRPEEACAGMLTHMSGRAFAAPRDPEEVAEENRQRLRHVERDVNK